MKLKARFFVIMAVVIFGLMGIGALNTYLIYRITLLNDTETNCDNTIHALYRMQFLTSELLSTETLDVAFRDWERSYLVLRKSIGYMNTSENIGALLSVNEKKKIITSMNHLWASAGQKLDRVQNGLAVFLEQENASKDGILLQYSLLQNKETFFLRSNIYDAGQYLATDFESRLRELLDIVHVEIRRQIRISIIQGVVISTAIILTIFLTLVPFLTKLRRHLGEIHQSMVHLGRGDFSIRLAIAGNDELSEIANVINLTTHNLDTMTERLEELVKERTSEITSTIEQLEEEVCIRKRTEEEIAKQRAEFEAIFNSISDGVVFADVNRHFALVNPAFTKLLGYEFEEIQGKSTEFIYANGENYKGLGKELFHQTAAVDQKIYEVEYKRKDGTTFHSETLAAHVRNHRKETIGYVGIIRDITERKAATDALVESERKFRTLANATSANIAIVQGDRFVYANKGFEHFAGMNLEKLRETPVGEVLPREGVEQGARAFARALEEKHTTYCYETADPRTGRWYEVNAGILEMDGESAVISTSFDITDRKLAYEQMYQTEKLAALGQIIAGVAHEINNPNNFIYFNLPILKKYIEAIRPILDEYSADKPDLKILNMPYDFFLTDIFKILENMEHGSKRITGIVTELKNHVRTVDTQDVKPEQLDLVVKHVMTLIGKQVCKMVKKFDVEVAENLPAIKMNAGKIEQVLINFIINAGQAANKEDSFVRLTAKLCVDETKDVEILIEDNGSGIAEESLHQIFEPFYTTKSREAGTGLGLSIAQRIIEDHGGSIRVKSTVGQGTCFTVRLPTIQG